MNRKVGAIVMSSTPFDDKGELDEPSLRGHLRRLRAAGIDGVYMGAPGAGETFSMRQDQRDRLIEVAVEELKGKTEVRAAGWEPRTAEEMMAFARSIERFKPDALLLYMIDMGHRLKPTVEEMDRYYSTVIDSTSLPIVLSIVPNIVGYPFPLELVGRLLDRFPSIIGLAPSGSEVHDLCELIHRFGDQVEIHCAGPAGALTGLMLGANGWEGFDGNFAPHLCVALIRAWRERDDQGVRQHFTQLMALNKLTGKYGGSSSMRAVKPLLNAFGLPGGGAMRPPRSPIGPEELDKLVAAVLRLQLPGIPTRL